MDNFNIETGEVNPNFIYDGDIIISKKDKIILEYQEALENWVLICQNYERQIKKDNIEKEKLMKELFTIKKQLDKTLNIRENNISYKESMQPKKKKRKLSKPKNFQEYISSTFKSF